MPSTALRQLALQAAATLLVLSLLWPYHGVTGQSIDWAWTATIIGLVAGLAATAARLSWWWRLIHFGFAPLAWAMAQLAIDPGWYLAAFIGLLLIYRGALTTQVPLYLSSSAAAQALIDRLPATGRRVVVDLGAGIGSVTLAVARARPDCMVIGVENSPVPWLIGWLRSRGQGNCRWRWGDLWQIRLDEADLVYAFLSPAPMPALWDKVRREMRAGREFVSNTFPVPDVMAAEAIAADDRVLHCYRIGRE